MGLITENIGPMRNFTFGNKLQCSCLHHRYLPEFPSHAAKLFMKLPYKKVEYRIKKEKCTYICVCVVENYFIQMVVTY